MYVWQLFPESVREKRSAELMHNFHNNTGDAAPNTFDHKAAFRLKVHRSALNVWSSNVHFSQTLI